MQLKRSDESVYITISEDKGNGWVFLDWEGRLELEQVKEGSEAGLAMLKEAGCKKMLVNNQKVTSPWHQANEWYLQDWNPRIYAAGLQFMAVIVSSNIFSEISLKNFGEKTAPAYQLEIFKEEKAAINWLKAQKVI